MAQRLSSCCPANTAQCSLSLGGPNCWESLFAVLALPNVPSVWKPVATLAEQARSPLHRQTRCFLSDTRGTSAGVQACHGLHKFTPLPSLALAPAGASWDKNLAQTFSRLCPAPLTASTRHDVRHAKDCSLKTSSCILQGDRAHAVKPGRVTQA